MKNKNYFISIFCFITAIIMSITLVACGKDKSENNNENNANLEKFTITFYDENGSVLESKKWNKNEVPFYNYVKENTEEYTFTFEGWSLTKNGQVLQSLPKVVSDAYYYAIVSARSNDNISFSGNETTVEEVKNLSFTVFKDKYETLIENYLQEDKEKAELIYRMCVYNIGKLSGEVRDVKVKVNEMYAEMCNAIKSIGKVVDDISELKQLAMVQLNVIYKNAISVSENVKDTIENAYLSSKNQIENSANKDTIKLAVNQFTNSVLNLVVDKIYEQLDEVKNKITAELNSLISSALDKVEDVELRNELEALYSNVTALVDNLAIASDENVNGIKNEISERVKIILIEQLVKLKEKAKAELTALVYKELEKIEDEELKTEINNFYNQEIYKIDEIDSIDNAKETMQNIVLDTKNFIKILLAKKIEGLKSTVKTYISNLSTAINVSPYDFIPDAMETSYSANFVEKNSLIEDYTSFVYVSDINYGGFGAQWDMVTEKISMFEKLYDILSKGDSFVKVSFATLNEYLSSEYTDTINTDIDNENYSVRLNYFENILEIFLQYKTGIDVSGLGSISPSVKMNFDIVNNTKTISIKLTDTNAIKYVVSENKLEFGYSLGMSQGGTSAYFSIEKNDDVTEGKVYEIYEVSGKEAKTSAEFYINDKYVTVVGNKVDSMLGFKGYVSEVYDKNNGKLLGFECREEVSNIIYNTLWFNLSDISGISDIKMEKNEDSKSGYNTYLNDSENMFTPTYNEKNVLGVKIKTSRKYDIEMKYRYFYGINSETGEIEKYEIQVPMMFIQEGENYNSYHNDMLNDNQIDSHVELQQTALDFILSEYDSKIPIYIEDKDSISSDKIKEFLGMAD